MATPASDLFRQFHRQFPDALDSKEIFNSEAEAEAYASGITGQTTTAFAGQTVKWRSVNGDMKSGVIQAEGSIISQKGGWRTVLTIAGRDAIKDSERELGMIVYVIEDDTDYTLREGLTNDVWEVFSSGSGELPKNVVISPDESVKDIVTVTREQFNAMIANNELVDGTEYNVIDDDSSEGGGNSIFYVDLVNGNDSNSGLSWADAFLTVQKAITSTIKYSSISIQASDTPILDIGNIYLDSSTHNIHKDVVISLSGGGNISCANINVGHANSLRFYQVDNLEISNSLMLFDNSCFRAKNVKVNNIQLSGAILYCENLEVTDRFIASRRGMAYCKTYSGVPFGTTNSPNIPGLINDGALFIGNGEINIPIQFGSGIELKQSFYVDTVNGLDTNDGFTAYTAFKTLQKAIDSTKYISEIMIWDSNPVDLGAVVVGNKQIKLVSQSSSHSITHLVLAEFVTLRIEFDVNILTEIDYNNFSQGGDIKLLTKNLELSAISLSGITLVCNSLILNSSNGTCILDNGCCIKCNSLSGTATIEPVNALVIKGGIIMNPS